MCNPSTMTSVYSFLNNAKSSTVTYTISSNVPVRSDVAFVSYPIIEDNIVALSMSAVPLATFYLIEAKAICSMKPYQTTS